MAIFRDFRNIPFLKDRFFKFARGTLRILSNTFKRFAGILLGPVAFLRFNIFINFIKGFTSLGSAGLRKNVFSRGLSRKSEYFLSVCTFFCFLIFQRL